MTKFPRRVSVGRAVFLYDNYGSSCYSFRQWLNFDKIIRRNRVIYNIFKPYLSISGIIK